MYGNCGSGLEPSLPEPRLPDPTGGMCLRWGLVSAVAAAVVVEIVKMEFVSL